MLGDGVAGWSLCDGGGGCGAGGDADDVGNSIGYSHALKLSSGCVTRVYYTRRPTISMRRRRRSIRAYVFAICFRPGHADFGCSYNSPQGYPDPPNYLPVYVTTAI